MVEVTSCSLVASTTTSPSRSCSRERASSNVSAGMRRVSVAGSSRVPACDPPTYPPRSSAMARTRASGGRHVRHFEADLAGLDDPLIGEGGRLLAAAVVARATAGADARAREPHRPPCRLSPTF